MRALVIEREGGLRAGRGGRRLPVPSTASRSPLRASSSAPFPRCVVSQGSTVDPGGYWIPEPAKVAAAMNPSATLNKILG